MFQVVVVCRRQQQVCNQCFQCCHPQASGWGWWVSIVCGLSYTNNINTKDLISLILRPHSLLEDAV